jgi:hypothetical protein
VAVIAVPPLLLTTTTTTSPEEDAATMTSCRLSSSSSTTTATTLVGIGAILASALIGSGYLISWRVFSERRFFPNELGKVEGFFDTHMTLGMIGLTNFLFGWPLLIVFDWLIETEELNHLEGVPPPFDNSTTIWCWLVVNGLVEYAFDASCAMTIFWTSPVVTAIVSPLTIPISFWADAWLWGDDGDGDGAAAAGENSNVSSWIGVLIILAGVVLMETKPRMLGTFFGHPPTPPTFMERTPSPQRIV